MCAADVLRAALRRAVDCYWLAPHLAGLALHDSPGFCGFSACAGVSSPLGKGCVNFVVLATAAPLLIKRSGFNVLCTPIHDATAAASTVAMLQGLSSN